MKTIAVKINGCCKLLISEILRNNDKRTNPDKRRIVRGVLEPLLLVVVLEDIERRAKILLVFADFNILKRFFLLITYL